MMTYVIARYNEDISWCSNIPGKFIVQKGEHLPNLGRESSSYLWYIINHYDALNNYYCFRQGNPFLCPVNLFNHHSDLSGLPYDELPYLKNVIEYLELEVPETLMFSPGAQLDVTTDQILSRSREWYIRCYDLSIDSKLSDQWEVAWCLERLWKYIFNL